MISIRVQWFEDQETGAILQRPGLLALKEAIFAGTVKTVVVWKLDRLARSMREGINTLTAWCESGVRVVSVTQQIDLSGTVGHLVAGVLFAIAEIELQHTRERQAAGITAAKGKRRVQRTRKGHHKGQAPQSQGAEGPGLDRSRNRPDSQRLRAHRLAVSDGTVGREKPVFLFPTVPVNLWQHGRDDALEAT